MNNNPSPRRVILPKPGRSVDESTITRRPSWRGCPKIVAGFAPRFFTIKKGRFRWTVGPVGPEFSMVKMNFLW